MCCLLIFWLDCTFLTHEHAHYVYFGATLGNQPRCGGSGERPVIGISWRGSGTSWQSSCTIWSWQLHAWTDGRCTSKSIRNRPECMVITTPTVEVNCTWILYVSLVFLFSCGSEPLPEWGVGQVLCRVVPETPAHNWAETVATADSDYESEGKTEAVPSTLASMYPFLLCYSYVIL